MKTTLTSYGPRTVPEWRNSMLNQVAYIKPVLENGQPAFSVHSADGKQLAIITDRATAFWEVRSHDLEPVSVH